MQPLFGPEDTATLWRRLRHFPARRPLRLHVNPARQRLVVPEGTGLTQQWGGHVEQIRAGDVVWCPPGVKHWHGAAPDSTMTHLAMTSAGDSGNVTRLEKVSDAEYSAYQKRDNDIRDLAPRQQAMVTIAAFTAAGSQPERRAALNDGLNAGLTISEIKEIQVPLYAYAGFPHSLNALTTFLATAPSLRKGTTPDNRRQLPAGWFAAQR